MVHDLRAADVAVTHLQLRRVPAPKRRRRWRAFGSSRLVVAAMIAGMLKAAVEAVDADTIIAHFAYPELLNAAIASGKRVFAGMANSYNQPGLKQWLRRKRIAHILNNKRIRMITNHCVPSTEHLASIGVDRRKLVPWDVPHRFEPFDNAPKELTKRMVRGRLCWLNRRAQRCRRPHPGIGAIKGCRPEHSRFFRRARRNRPNEGAGEFAGGARSCDVPWNCRQ